MRSAWSGTFAAWSRNSNHSRTHRRRVLPVARIQRCLTAPHARSTAGVRIEERTVTHVSDREMIAGTGNPLGMDGIEFVEFSTSKPQALGRSSK